MDSQGTPLEGPYTLTVRLYDAATAGTKLWEEQHVNVPLAGGHFSVLLGQFAPLGTMNWSQPCWLSVQVNADPELSPRQQITSVPLALMAEQLSGPLTTVGGRVGIGTSAPGTLLEVSDGTPSVGFEEDVLRLARNNHCNLHIQAAGAFHSNVMFSDPAQPGVGRIRYDHSDDSMRLWTAGAERLALLANGHVGIGRADPPTILSVMPNSPTDPIADAWTVYPSDRAHKDLLGAAQPGCLERLRAVALYEWRRKPLVTDDEAKAALKKERCSLAELEAARRELAQAKARLPKFTAARIGMAIDDANVPPEILAYNADGTVGGIDLLAYIGYLHAALKEVVVKLDELEARLSAQSPAW